MRLFLTVKIICFFQDFMQTVTQTALLKSEGKGNSSKKMQLYDKIYFII